MTVMEFLQVLLYIAGIGVLIFLIKLFKDLSDTIQSINKILEINKFNINETIDQIPEITKNVNSMTKTVDDGLSNMMPEVEEIVNSANVIANRAENVTGQLQDTTNKVSSTVDDVTNSISSSAREIQKSVDDITGNVVSGVDYTLNIVKRLLESFFRK